MNHTTLLLTATIDPQACPLVKRRDPALRLQDYMDSLRRWLNEPFINDIVFAENSGASLDRLRLLADKINPFHKNITFLSYCTNLAESRGKGYGEVDLIEKALDKSHFVDTSRILKVTGRYHVANLGALQSCIETTPADILSCPFILPGWIASECFDCSVAFLRYHFFPNKHLIDDNRDMFCERILAASIRNAVEGFGLRHAIFAEHPILTGISGGFNVPWSKTHFATGPIINADNSVTIRDVFQFACLRRLLAVYSESSAPPLSASIAVHLVHLRERLLCPGDKPALIVLTPADILVLKAVLDQCTQPSIVDSIQSRHKINVLRYIDFFRLLTSPIDTHRGIVGGCR